MRLMLLDPSIRENEQVPNHNLGDLIIRDAIDRELSFLFSGNTVERKSTHLPFSWGERLRANRADLRLVCGTNLLASKMDKYSPWKVNRLDALVLKPVTLVGVGWWSDQEEPNEYTRRMLRRLLSRTGLHSVRDEMTRARLERIGFDNVLNTGCPTMWALDGKSDADYPAPDTSSVITTISYWRKKEEEDRGFLEFLKKHYRRVTVWPQGQKDRDYVRDLGVEAEVLEYSAEAFRDFVKANPNSEYLGLRLHGGIRCLQLGLRSLIVIVDNRAREIARDTGLPVVARDDYETMERWITAGIPFRIKINMEAVERFKSQFAEAKR